MRLIGAKKYYFIHNIKFGYLPVLLVPNNLSKKYFLAVYNPKNVKIYTI